MVRRILGIVLSSLLTLWAIATGTFFLLEHAPGGPQSEERRLDPAAEVANLAAIGLADRVVSPCDGTVTEIPGAGESIPDSGVAARIHGSCDVPGRPGHEVMRVLVTPGEAVRAGQAILATRPSLPERYFRAMASIATLDLGATWTSRGERTVRENLAQTLPVSAAIGGLALLFALVLGIPAGLVAASRAGSAADRLLTALATAAVSVPAIVLGPLLLYLFAIRFRVFSAGGLDSATDLVLPAATLGLILAGVLHRMTRAGAAAFLAGPVPRSLRGRGLSEARILGVHAFRHAVLTLLGFLPPVVASLLTGSVVVEQVFNVPGVSRYLVGAALNRDLPMVMGVVLVYSLFLVACTTTAELLYPVIDPRLRSVRRAP
jgi:oligopeptide transport system permease protein